MQIHSIAQPCKKNFQIFSCKFFIDSYVFFHAEFENGLRFSPSRPNFLKTQIKILKIWQDSGVFKNQCSTKRKAIRLKQASERQFLMYFESLNPKMILVFSIDPLVSRKSQLFFRKSSYLQSFPGVFMRKKGKHIPGL